MIRRQFLASTAAVAALPAAAATPKAALIAITLDLEMSRHYEKGNLEVIKVLEEEQP